ncbi:hypothetical protein O181_026396 [Austropuccinia psidii MF-1]|uniref:Uncharacterized protein n=1 Tax=Austropuccinia psidii MF-1 TaxID=1389203 RepID=A0A9Q3CQC5_9BASI|nr:hypothetical protein [Austropuccinia psidii MF-1]
MKIEIHLFVAFIILCTSISHSSKLPDKKGTQAQALEPDAARRRKHQLDPFNPRDPRHRRNPGDPRARRNPGDPPEPEQPPE